ncbi:DUF433 domain-containing protein [Thermodesulfitimonas autotrophica]|uniref:DUF433 domain-containing protein n=1 Tax=Thermodesulfitimonas autotrophica TaxID=1894989 RepID=UPI00319E6460
MWYNRTHYSRDAHQGGKHPGLLGCRWITPQEILEDYPALEPEDIKACLAYACIPAI